jgi:hypothetical protein
MKCPDIKQLMIRSLNPGADAADIARQMENAGVSYDFGDDFAAKLSEKLFGQGRVIPIGTDFVTNLSSVFYRIAVTGVAAIILLLISIFIMEGSLSVNSFLGITDTYDESIVYLLTGY